MRNFGLSHIPEDRHKMGLINRFEAKEAFILGYHRRAQYNKGWLQDKEAIRQDCQAKMDKWDVRPPSPEHKTANFSGGNQQKLVIARKWSRTRMCCWSASRPGRRHRRHRVHPPADHRHARQGQGGAAGVGGAGRIMSLSDRILVIADGRIVGELDGARADERTIGLMMANIVPDDVATSQSQEPHHEGHNHL